MIVFSIVRLKVYVVLSASYQLNICQTQKFYSFILGIEGPIFKQKPFNSFQVLTWSNHIQSGKRKNERMHVFPPWR